MKTNFTPRMKMINLFNFLAILFFVSLNISAYSQSLPQDPPNPGSNSPQCYINGVTMSFTGSVPVGETWYWQTSAGGTNTANSSASFTVSTSGVYYVRSQNNTSLVWSAGAGQVTVTVDPGAGIPVFAIGNTSTRCQGGGTTVYTATASNSTGMSYSIDAITAAFPGNSINAATGALTYAAGWSGTTVVTATATGCSGIRTSTHAVTTVSTVGNPVFAMGSSSTRCMGAAIISYTATATTSTGLTYSLDANSAAGGNTINSVTGTVTYNASYSGTSLITVVANGCNGPAISVHTVSIGSLGALAFTLGASSTRCQGAGTITYTATAQGVTAVSYSLDAASIAAGITINASTGQVAYPAGWTGITVITASAQACGGTASVTHVATTLAALASPVFILGPSSTRCQGAGASVYTAILPGAASITYSIDAASIAAGISINAANGAVTFLSNWVGPTTVTATAPGCNGPVSATHTITILPSPGSPVFSLGATSTRCQGAGTIIYTATVSGTSSINYSLDPASIAAGVTINAATGAVTYPASWAGTTVITASVPGCGGIVSATHVVSIVPNVSNPVFAAGAASSRCQQAGAVTYTATASNNAGITYTLDPVSLANGNSINSTTGTVTYTSGWTGPSVVTAHATGCNGPLSATHTITIIPSVGQPVFAMGETSTRIKGAGAVIYTATAANSTGISYTLDAASMNAGNTIESTTGNVVYTAGWVGISKITATAAGCNGPVAATHTVTTTAQFNLTVQPNPFVNTVHLSVKLKHASQVQFRILNFAGNIIYQNSAKGVQGTNSYSINDLGKLPTGNYLIQVVTDEGNSFEKLVKQ